MKTPVPSPIQKRYATLAREHREERMKTNPMMDANELGKVLERMKGLKVQGLQPSTLCWDDAEAQAVDGYVFNDVASAEEAPDAPHRPFVISSPRRAPVFSSDPIKHVERIAIADLPVKPRFRMGIEFEGAIRSEVYGQFENALCDLCTDEEGSCLVQFGEDPSIKHMPEGYTAVEIRTETVGSRTGIRLFEDMLCFLYTASQTDDWITNESCGLHINISEVGIFEAGKQTDYYCHMLRLFDESSVLARFGRLGTPQGTKYCRPFFKDGMDREFEAIKHQYQLCKRRERAARDRGSEVNQQIKESKYYAVSLRDSPQHEDYDGRDEEANRIEFRCIGNEGYHLRFEDLDESVNHIISVVRMAYREVMR